jgi:hypothetical protein
MTMQLQQETARKVTFCTKLGDRKAEEAITILERLGCKTQFLSEGELAPEGSVAFFTLNGTSNFRFRHRHVKISPNLREEIIPIWARTTPFVVAVRNHPHIQDTFPVSIKRAAAEMEMKVANDTTILFTEGLYKRERRQRKERKGKGWEVSQRNQAEITEIQLSSNQREKESLVVSAFGAFNYGVCMELPDKQLHRIYLETVKRLALVAEQANAGAGGILFSIIDQLAPQDIFSDMVIDYLGLGESGINSKTHELLEIPTESFLERMHSAMDYVAPGGTNDHRREFLHAFESGSEIKVSAYPKLEAILVYGKAYEDLSEDQQEICRRYQLADEFKHFSRIMDPDMMCEIKKVVGTADAGNPRIVRLLSYAADYRKRLGLYTPWPMPGRIEVEVADFSDPMRPIHVRRNAPYIGAVVSASDQELAKDMMDILRKLVTQHPIEMAISMVEDWLMAGAPDSAVSISAFQIHNDGENFLVKAVGIGGGGVVFRNGSGNKLLQFPKTGKKYGDLEVGRLDYQHPLHQFVFPASEGDVVEAFSSTSSSLYEEAWKNMDGVSMKKIPTKGVAKSSIGKKQQKPVSIFQWTERYAREQLDSLIGKIVELRPQSVHIQFGHIHSDRDAGPEQETGGFMARVFADELERQGTSVSMVEPLVDNLHVTDRIDVQRFLEDMSTYFGRPVESVSFEASVLTRRLADEMIIKLYQICPERIVRKGHNVYLRVNEGTIIELYDGVGADAELRGRQGCVPFEGGYEIRRLNPALASEMWKEIIFRDYPDSIVAQWWRRDPKLDFEALMAKYVYRENPERRAALKAQMDREIDHPYREKILAGNTDFLDAFLERVDKSRQALIHFLEGVYDAQHKKFAAFMALSNVLPMNIWRISFDRHMGRIVVLDCNEASDKLGLA